MVKYFLLCELMLDVSISVVVVVVVEINRLISSSLNCSELMGKMSHVC